MLLAEVHAKVGDVEGALTALAEATAITAQMHEGIVEPEIYRLNGELVVDPAEAEICFHRASEIARRQKRNRSS